MQNRFTTAAALRIALGTSIVLGIASAALAQGIGNAGLIGPKQIQPGTKDTLNGKLNRGPMKFLPRPNVVLVTFKAGASKEAARNVLAATGLVADPHYKSDYLVRAVITPEAQMKGMTVPKAIQLLRRNSAVRLADADMPVYKEQVNDPQYAQQWGLNNTGQTGGTNDADIDAPEAWGLISSAPNVIVAVCDDAVEINHPDLDGNIFNNDDIPLNGIDDDGNGFIDDYRGWDFADNDNDPSPPTVSDSHGTHVAGIVAAVSNNSTGVASASRNVKILPLRFYKGQSAWQSDLILALDYARLNGAKVVNVSYNLDGWNQTYLDAVLRLNTADVIYVNSAGNNAQQDPPRLGMKAQAPNSTFVVATDHNDDIAGFSNYGLLCDFGAPGDTIRSTVPYGGYSDFSGTSMAAPFAAGVLGTVRSLYPSLTAPQIIARVANSSDLKPQFAGNMAKGRINLANALENDSIAPSNPGPITLSRRSYSVVRLNSTASGDDGSVGSASSYEVRVSPNPITAANFSSATLVGASVPTPTGGTPISFDLGGLSSSSTFYVAMKAFDNVGNESGVVSAGPFKTAKPVSVDNMETPGTYSATGTWALTTAFAASPTQSWTDSPGGDYANNADSAITSGPMMISDPSSLSFKMRHNLETGWDFLRVEVSSDGGTTWTELRRIDGVSTVFANYSVDLSAYAGQTIRVRFRLTSDSSVVRDGVYIDDVELTKAVLQSIDNVEGPAKFSAGGSTWVVSTEFASSPVNAWNDSPGVNYAANTNQLLTGNFTLNTTNLAGARFGFRGRLNLEPGYDFLTVEESSDGGATYQAKAAFDDEETFFRSYSLPLANGTAQRVRIRLTSDGSVQRQGAALDDFVMVGAPWINCLLGTVTLSNYSSSTLRNFTLQIRTAGTTTVLESIPIQLSGTANTFEIESTLPAGTYDVSLKGAHFLRRTLTNVNLSASTPVTMTLINGDVNGDNSVGTLDFNQFRAAIGSTATSPNWNPMADLNGDGSVGTTDFNILRASFGQTGNN